MWSEHYPYASGSTIISAVVLRPEIWADTYGNRYEDTIYDPYTDSFYTRETFEETVRNDPGHGIVIFMPWREEWIPFWLTMPHMTVASDAMKIEVGYRLGKLLTCPFFILQNQGLSDRITL